MLRLATDENFNGDIVRGLIQRQSDLDIVRSQDSGLLGADDPRILNWAAIEGRVFLTHDRATVPDFAHQHVVAGLRMPGVFVVGSRLPIGRAIEDLLILTIGSESWEWEGILLYLPL